MSTLQPEDDSSYAERKRELEQIRDHWQGTPFAEMAEAWLDDLTKEGDT